jgi:ABC-type transport system involved in multi-copper enzyme maturation permease subunit
LSFLTATSWVVRRHGRREGPAPQVSLLSPPQPVAPSAEGAPSGSREEAEAGVVASNDASASAVENAVVSPPLLPTVNAPPAAADGAARRVGNNPVLWRELRRPLVAGRFANLAGILVVLVLVISYACFAASSLLNSPELQVGYALIFHGLFWLFTAVLSATAIAQEKESDTWTLLLTAPLSAGSIVGGKLLGILRRMLWPTILITAHFTLFTITSVITVPQLFVILWVLLTFNSVWAASGLYLSLRVKKVTAAVIINLMIAVVLYAAVPVAAATIGQLTSRSDKLLEATGLYIPFVYLAQMADYSWRQTSRSTVWFPLLGQINPSTFVALTIFAGMVHLAASAAIVAATARHFNRLVGRAEQVLPLVR